MVKKENAGVHILKTVDENIEVISDASIKKTGNSVGKNFRSPSKRKFNPESGSVSGPVLAIIIAVVLVAALGVVGFLFLKSQEAKKDENKTSTAANTEPVRRDGPVEKQAMEAASPRSESGVILIHDSAGNLIAAITKKDSGKYSVKGDKNWKIKIDSDRVKVKTASGKTLVKIKQKDYGFKITGANDKAILKGKFRGSGFKAKTDDKELGRVESAGSGYRITDASGKSIGMVSVSGDTVEVKNSSGKTMFKIQGASAKAAAFFPLLEDRLDAQLGLLVYFNEF